MHRSGTSALTRALGELGASLGSKLLEPSPSENPKGYFEDLDVLALNKKILEIFNTTWDGCLVPDFSKLRAEELEPLLDEGKNIIRNRFAEENCIAIKDPRLCLTLPFWKIVFKTLEIEPYYLIALRNPISVMQSLKKRNGFSAEKSYCLWQAHLLHNFLNTDGSKRLIVDYDLFLDNCDQQIARIANWLEHTFDPQADSYKLFKENFLDSELRHSRFVDEHLDQEPAISPAVKALWSLASAAARDEIDLKILNQQPELQNTRETWLNMQPLSIVLNESLQTIGTLQKGQKESFSLLKQQEAKIKSLEDLGKAQQASIEQLNRELEAIKSEKLRSDEIIQELITSKSWKLTAPLRNTVAIIRKVFFFDQSPTNIALGFKIYTSALRSKLSPSSSPTMMFIVESGALEPQSLALAESVRLHAGVHRSARLVAISPRPMRRPSWKTVLKLKLLGVKYIPLDLKSPVPDYGTSFRVLASAWLEKNSNAEFLAVLDTDTIFVSEPDLSLSDSDVALRPVDTKGICTSGETDYFDEYWRQLCQLAKVDYSAMPEILTSIDQQRIKASYNGGFIVCRRSNGLFEKTAELFCRSLRAGLVPHPELKHNIQAGHGAVPPAGGMFWGSSQACLAVVILALGLKTRIMPASQNFPLHLYKESSSPELLSALISLSHLHYHRPLSDPQLSVRLLDPQLNLNEGVKNWISRRVLRQAA